MDMNEVKAKLEELATMLAKVRDELETVRDDYQDYYDEMSEEWKGSETGEQYDVDIDSLTSYVDQIDVVESDLFEFAKAIKSKQGKPTLVKEDDEEK